MQIPWWALVSLSWLSMAYSSSDLNCNFLDSTDDSWWTCLDTEENNLESNLNCRHVTFIMSKEKHQIALNLPTRAQDVIKEKKRSAPKPRAKQIAPTVLQVTNRKATDANSTRDVSNFKSSRPFVITKWSLGDFKESTFHFEEIAAVGAEPKVTNHGLKLEMDNFVCEATLEKITLRFSIGESDDPTSVSRGLSVVLQTNADSKSLKIATKSFGNSPIDACIFRSFAGKYRSLIDVDDSEAPQNGDMVIIASTESISQIHTKEFSASDALVTLVSGLSEKVGWALAAKITVRPFRIAPPEPKPAAIMNNQSIEWIEAKIHQLFEESRGK